MGRIDIYKPPCELRELNILEELQKNPISSQRELSQKFGIALGVTNACLKRMARRGWIQITGLNHHKIGYFLTPKGFAEKTRLTFHLISWTVQHYSALKDIIGKRLLEMQHHGIERIVFYGVSDEMEIAYVTLQRMNLRLVGIVEDEGKLDRKEIFGFELMGLDQVKALRPDAVLITSLIGQDEKKNKIAEFLDPRGVYIAHI